MNQLNTFISRNEQRKKKEMMMMMNGVASEIPMQRVKTNLLAIEIFLKT